MELSLSKNGLTEMFIPSFSFSLLKLRYLRDIILNLSYNKISDLGAILLANLFQKQKSIVNLSLYLQNNLITMKGATILMETL